MKKKRRGPRRVRNRSFVGSSRISASMAVSCSSWGFPQCRISTDFFFSKCQLRTSQVDRFLLFLLNVNTLLPRVRKWMNPIDLCKMCFLFAVLSMCSWQIVCFDMKAVFPCQQIMGSNYIRSDESNLKFRTSQAINMSQQVWKKKGNLLVELGRFVCL